ncbi:MAG: hypothetical protein NT004_19825 [Bacteroidetes bacterium]|nr:hypothetical protein [Bacteroidota bacterium]
MKKTLLILLIILSDAVLFASEKAVVLNFNTVDILTYRLYMERKWDSVIIIGKLALREDIDFYYLRVRMGIAYFEKQAYYPAVTHLKKARQFNSDDPAVANYLYYACRYTDRGEEASLLRAGMTPESRKLIDDKEGFLDLIHLESGYTLSSDKSPGNLATLMESDSIYGEQDLYGNSFYANLGLKLRLSNRVSLSLAYNYLQFDKTKYIQYGRGEDQLVSITDTSWGKVYNYDFPWVVYNTSFNYQVKQQEIHIGASYSPGAGFRIMPAFHFIHVAYTATNPGYRFDTVQDPAYYTAFDSTMYTFPFARLNYSFPQSDTSFNNYVAALKITKDFGLFNLGLSGSYSNLNGSKQKQIGLSLTYFPFGNLNFYGTTSVTGFSQGKKDSRLLFSQVLGAKITSWMWAEGNIYYGDYTNANIFNGSVVYNNSDAMNYRAGASLIFVISKHISLSLIYQYTSKESQQIYYVKKQNSATQEINEVQTSKYNPYHTNTIIGGITWKL